MNYVPDIIDTIKKSVVTRILVVDDSYDAPTFSVENSGALADFLQADDLRTHLGEDLVSDDNIQAAMEAIAEDELDAEDVTLIIDKLYAAYVKDRTEALDPNGIFAASKGGTLDVLEPLVEMLSNCEDIEVKLVGFERAIEVCKEQNPDLIFMDFFLSPPSRGKGPETKGEESSDRSRSITTMKSMLSGHSGDKPAVVLMSSKDIQKRVESYRTNLAGQVMGLRFGYLRKQWVSGSGENLKANGNAADVLVDTSGSLAFGRSLEAALTDWQAGAKKALEKMQKELLEFDVKDFAYHMRFQLYEENQPFADYLEWFLGESLRAAVDEEVQWSNDHFQELNEENLTKSISGAHPFPSDKIARFFHRMRFNSHAVRKRERFALGDVFLSSNKEMVRMVISPDCDLVVRDGKRAAARLLTVGGKVKSLTEEEAFAGEMVHLGAPKGIKWLYKDLMTHATTDVDKLNVDGGDYKFLGKLRGLPAQAIQKAALADLSRVGVSVPPTVHVGAKVTCFIKTLEGNQVEQVKVDSLPSATVQVLMPRGGGDGKKRILFTQNYARALVAHLKDLDAEKIHKDHAIFYNTAIKDSEELRQTMVSGNLKLPESLEKFSIATKVGVPSKKPWLQFVCDLEDEHLVVLEAWNLD